MKSVTFEFRVTVEFSRRHCNLKPKCFDFCIEYKPIDRTCPFHYQILKLFGLLEEIGIKSSVAFLKCFSIQCILCTEIRLLILIHSVIYSLFCLQFSVTNLSFSSYSAIAGL